MARASASVTDAGVPHGRIDEPGHAGQQLRLSNLLNDAEALTTLLLDCIQAAQWLDAYLLACGVDQILEDALHPDLGMLGKISRQLDARVGGTFGRLAASITASSRTGIWALHSRSLSVSALFRYRQQVAQLVTDLAGAAVRQGEDAATGAPADLLQRVARLRDELAGLPVRVRRDPARLPSGFRNLDQSPHDVKALVDLALRRWPEAQQPFLVVGVRTTGSYLAPLAAACLEQAGRPHVRWMTLRPGQRWLPNERRAIRWATRSHAITFLLDDPPNSWGTMRKAALELRSMGLDPSAVALLVQGVPGAAPPPDVLGSHPVITLPWDQWHIQSRLAPEVVQQTLQRLVGGDTAIGAVTCQPSDRGDGARKHVRALYEVEFTSQGGQRQHRLITAEGVGLGYFGTHSLAVGAPLQAYLPRIYGVVDGLLYRDWLPEARRLGEAPAGAATEQIVEYVRAHARAHRVADDVSLRARGRHTLRRWAGRYLARPFGRAEVFFWPVAEAAARALLHVDVPSVVDGNTALPNWFGGDLPDTRLKKVGFAQRAFSGYELFCYDAVFDLAGVAASCESKEIDRRLRDLYAAHSGDSVELERWLLYQLAHLNGFDEDVQDPELERRMSRRFQRYFSDVLLRDISIPRTGALCAIDIDGVLEVAPLGVTTANETAVRALRALNCHGYRVVLATGRSVGEVRDRCVHYRLAGGVAEYGAAIYETSGDRVRELLTTEERERLSRLRVALEHVPGVLLDGAYRFAVRAYRLNTNGRRRALRTDQVAAVLEQISNDRIRAIHGEGQTDFVVDRVTKATGLRALASDLGVSEISRDRLALAVGDTVSDVPVLRLARLGFAPANADREVRAAGVATSRYAHQAGLEDGVAHLLGHRPGSCATCAGPDLSPRAQLLLLLLGSPRKASRASKAAWGATVTGKLMLGLFVPGGRWRQAAIESPRRRRAASADRTRGARL